MNFDLNEDRRMLRDTLEKFLRDKYPIEKRLEYSQSEHGFSSQMWQEFADLGIIGALFEEDAGGFGGHGDDLMVVFEQLGKALVVEPFLSTGILSGTILSAVGSNLVEGVIGGQTQVSLAHLEPASRYDLAHIEASAQQQGDEWIINGHKAVVLGAGSADKLIVSARTSGAFDDENGISLFLVDSMANGVEKRPYSTIDGYGAADLTLNNSPAQLLGEKDNGFALVEKAHARAIVAICSQCLGASEAAKDMTVEYMHTRKQFGVIIGKFQVLQHRMADVLIELEQMRSSIINAAGFLEDERDLREKHCSAAKNLTGRAGRQIAEEAIQIHGGIAMTWEASVSHYAKHIIMIDHLFGDTDHHLERYIELG